MNKKFYSLRNAEEGEHIATLAIAESNISEANLTEMVAKAAEDHFDCEVTIVSLSSRAFRNPVDVKARLDGANGALACMLELSPSTLVEE